MLMTYLPISPLVLGCKWGPAGLAAAVAAAAAADVADASAAAAAET